MTPGVSKGYVTCQFCGEQFPSKGLSAHQRSCKSRMGGASITATIAAKCLELLMDPFKLMWICLVLYVSSHIYQAVVQTFVEAVSIKLWLGVEPWVLSFVTNIW